MDLSDDIAYSVHDFEDADRQRLPRSRAPRPTLSEHSALLTAIQSWVGFDFARDELEDALYRLMRLPEWIDSFDGTRARAGAAQEPHLRPDRPLRPCRDDGDARGVRRRPCSPATARTSSCRASSRPRWRCSRASSAPPSSRSRDARRSTRSSAACSRGSPRRCGSDPRRSTRCTREDFAAAETDAARRRAVVDQVASLTDQLAIAWHGRLVGEVDAASLGVWAPGAPKPRGARGVVRARRGRLMAGRIRQADVDEVKARTEHRRHHRRAGGAQERRRRRA